MVLFPPSETLPTMPELRKFACGLNFAVGIIFDALAESSNDVLGA